MSNLLDMPLDDIVKMHKSPTSRGGRGGGRGGRRTTTESTFGRRNRDGPKPVSGGRRGLQPRRAATSDNQWEHDRFDDGEVATGGRGNRLQGRLGSKPAAGGAKIHITNLFYNVSEADLEEVFASVGELKTVRIQYDRSGRSNGSADVVFVNREDAAKAVKQYNEVSLDGQPMQITLVTGASARNTAPSDDTEMEDLVISTSSRDTDRHVSTNDRTNRRFTQKTGSNFKPRGASRGSARGGFRRGGGRGGRGGSTSTPVTAADLDAELDDYITNK